MFFPISLVFFEVGRGTFDLIFIFIQPVIAQIVCLIDACAFKNPEKERNFVLSYQIRTVNVFTNRVNNEKL
jgi:hypothetical protein